MTLIQTYFRHSAAVAGLVLCALVINGCDGGNSSPHTSVVVVEYTGSQNLATLDRSNAMLFMHALLGGADAIITLGTSPAPYEYTSHFPSFYHVSYDDEEPVGESCDSGTINVRDTRSSRHASGTVEMEFRNCQMSGETFNGQLVVRFESEFSTLEVSVNNLVLSDSIDTVAYNGVIQVSEDKGIRTEEFIATSSALNESLKFTNFRARNRQMEGRVYLGKHGYVEFSEDRLASQIYVSGDSSSSLTLDYRRSLSMGSHLTGKIFDITLQQPAEDTIIEFLTTAHIDDIQAWPFTINQAPVLVIEEEYQIGRDQNLTLDASKSFDPEKDFLKFRWTVSETPASCHASVTPTSKKIATFRTSCHGKFSVTLIADDGISAPANKKIAINVLPLAAEFEPVQNLILDDEEALDIPLIITNSATDGPFDLKVAYGPEGIRISEDGRLIGRPVPFINDDQQKFTIGVEANNGKVSTLELQVELRGERNWSLLTSPAMCSNPLANAKLPGEDSAVYVICPFFHSFKIYKLEDGVFSHHYTELSPPQSRDLLSVGFSHFNEDSPAQIIMVYFDWIYVIDSLTYQIIEKIENVLDSGGRWIEVISAPRQHPGFFLNLGTGSDAGLNQYDAHTSRFFHFGDNPLLRQIGRLENENDPSNPPINYLNTLSAFPTVRGLQYQLVDFDGDGKMNLVSFSPTRSQTSNRVDVEVKAYDIVTTSTIAQTTVSITFGPQDNEPRVFQLLNLDDDPELQFVGHSTPFHQVWVFDQTESGFTLVENLRLPDGCGYHRDMQFYQSATKPGVAIVQGDEYGTYCEFSLATGFTPMTFSDPQLKGIFSTYVNQEGNLEAIAGDDRSNGELTKIQLNEDLSVLQVQALGIPENYERNVLMMQDSRNSPPERHLLWGFREIPTVYETSTFESLVAITESPAWRPFATTLHYQDVNNDGQNDVIGFSDNEMWIYDFRTDNNLILSFDYAADVNLAADLTGDGILEIVRLERTREFPPETSLAIYHVNNGKPKKIASRSDIDSGLSYHASKAALQDVNGDGILDIVLYYRDVHNGGITQVEVWNHKLELQAGFTLPESVKHIPTMTGQNAKSNFIAVVDYPEASQNIRASVNSQFVEVDARYGKIVWRSRPFLGQIEETGFSVLGEDAYRDEKTAVFESGLYRFR